MNNRGFTLIELLVTIVIIAAISVTVGLNMNGMLARQKDKDVAAFEKKVEDAACTYATLNDIKEGREVSIETLIAEGLLDKELVNPATGNTIIEEKEEKATIKYENNEKVCEYNASTN